MSLPSDLGSLERAVLGAIVALGDDAYPARIARSLGALDSGVRRSLMSLRIKGLVRDTLTRHHSGPSRRVYRLTAKAGAPVITEGSQDASPSATDGAHDVSLPAPA